MIVDCFTHTWESHQQLGRCAPDGLASRSPELPSDPALAGTARHILAVKPTDAAFVLGFKSRYLSADIPNDFVAAYVRTHPERLIGLAGIDPSDPREGIAEVNRAKHELGMRGIAVAPAAQDFHPSNSQAMLVYAEAAKLGLPVLFHIGVTITSATKLEYARPVLLDEVARELPNLRIVVAHLGYPWVHETLMLLAKHANVFAEISWLLHQPWQAYQALLSAHQFGVIDKLLFGSGFPSFSAAQAIENLYGLNHLVAGTNLPPIPREKLRGIVERDALGLLGIANGKPPAPANVAPAEEPSEV
jgi:uncharacterized protein